MQLSLLCTRHDSIDSIRIGDLGPLNVPTSILALSGDGRLRDVEAKLEELAVDARGAPQRVLFAHLPDEIA